MCQQPLGYAMPAPIGVNGNGANVSFVNDQPEDNHTNQSLLTQDIFNHRHPGMRVWVLGQFKAIGALWPGQAKGEAVNFIDALNILQEHGPNDYIHA
jgi:hypothetical protein